MKKVANFKLFKNKSEKWRLIRKTFGVVIVGGLIIFGARGCVNHLLLNTDRERELDALANEGQLGWQQRQTDKIEGQAELIEEQAEAIAELEYKLEKIINSISEDYVTEEELEEILEELEEEKECDYSHKPEKSVCIPPVVDLVPGFPGATIDYFTIPYYEGGRTFEAYGNIYSFIRYNGLVGLWDVKTGSVAVARCGTVLNPIYNSIDPQGNGSYQVGYSGGIKTVGSLQRDHDFTASVEVQQILDQIRQLDVPVEQEDPTPSRSFRA